MDAMVLFLDALAVENINNETSAVNLVFEHTPGLFKYQLVTTAITITERSNC